MDLGKDPIPELIRKLAIPASLGFFFNTMFNVVDTFYAGQLSTLALAALSFSMTSFLGFLALGIGLGQASNAMIGNEQGAGNRKQASHLAAQATSLGMIAGFIGLGGAGPGFELCLQWNVELPGRHTLFRGFDDRRFSGACSTHCSCMAGGQYRDRV